MCVGQRTPTEPAFAAALLAITCAAVRSYLRSLNPHLPRDVWILQAGGLANMFGNGVIGPFPIIYLHNVRGISLRIAGLVVPFNSAAGPRSGLVRGARFHPLRAPGSLGRPP